jgi:hypothetical protein
MGLRGMLPTRVRICKRHSLALSHEHLAGRRSFDGTTRVHADLTLRSPSTMSMRAGTVMFGPLTIEDRRLFLQGTGGTRDHFLPCTVIDRRHQRERDTGQFVEADPRV